MWRQAKESEWHLNTPSGDHPLTPPSTREQLTSQAPKRNPPPHPLVQMIIHSAKAENPLKQRRHATMTADWYCYCVKQN